MRSWDRLPDDMRTEDVRKYYDSLCRHPFGLILKRAFDIVMSLLLLILLSPLFLIVSVWIKKDSHGPVFFRQERVTRYGRTFRIFKFRTMIVNAEEKGTLVTVGNDSRITRVGMKIRHGRIDEIPQLLNVLKGDMSFVGTRPEVCKYTEQYTDEMKATLLMPAGITSNASIQYKDEDELLDKAENPDEVYVKEILPAKMKYNLEDILAFSVWNDIKTMAGTVKAVI
jgi:lipopolysaccharide/colanic/teichoic acid biosynthesis glycosyltransferase